MIVGMTKILEKIGAFFALSRPPFHIVGILPFVLGGVMALASEGYFRWDIFMWGVFGVVLIMLATYYAGEYWDYVEDSLSARQSSSRFSGGSQVLHRGLLPRRVALWASLTSLFLAFSVGLILQLGYGTGQWTILLGVLGIIGGFFYSTKPVRWVSTGLGELWIAFCYGWLPVAVGYYLQIGNVAPIINWIATPISLTVFNVILLNEFPDYSADTVAGKTNLAVRLGLERASVLYCFTSIASWLVMSLSLVHLAPNWSLWLYMPVLVLSAILVIMVKRGYWRSRVTLEKLCAANLAVNLSTTTIYLLVFAG